MDFDFTEDQTAIQELAGQIFSDKADTSRVHTVQNSDVRLDDVLWSELAKAGLLGMPIGEDHGGAGLGLVELCIVLSEQGKRVAPVPIWSASAAAMALAKFGGDASIVSGTADGTTRATVALEESGIGGPFAPHTRATASGDGYVLDGEKLAVPAFDGSVGAVVIAASETGPELFWVAADAEGISVAGIDTTNFEPAANLRFKSTPATKLDGGRDAVQWLVDRAYVMLSAIQLGNCDSSMRQTGEYLSTREQFGRPIATFQAAAHQLADCYIEVECMSLTLWQAAWQLDADEAGEPLTGFDDDLEFLANPSASALVAKWWCDDAGQRIVHRVMHLHGGIGLDIDYPIHRHYLWGKQMACTLSGASSDLDRLGEYIAGSDMVTSKIAAVS